MLATLTQEDFNKQVNTPFIIKTNKDDLALELTEVKVLRKAQEENQRDQFSLLFKGDPQRFLPQQIYQLNHKIMGELSLFLVPIGREHQSSHLKEGAYLYEAVFT
ncbi:hypothetical protein H0A36_19325 [Endozoicomonas sp. SM1973]|uniref:DUF6916 domain-containing protein n=1 Tax=Spartinivicinus marinus TaxID=2994442 RepID=A0A853I486_9GAMM|nr:hypothetical protein [Spartinivicinus marinus]MCX4029334.1 hypothetical protein [Spartinivicinus marinus]NYZ68173.1 hypothetical protein [Spartinivicinus marinus]